MFKWNVLRREKNESERTFLPTSLSLFTLLRKEKKESEQKKEREKGKEREKIG